MLMKNEIYSISDAAKLLNCTRQAIYLSVLKKKINSQKVNGKWTVTIDDIKEFQKNKYDRKFSTYQDRPLYEEDKGEMSVKYAAEKIKVPAQKLYYAIRSKKMNAFKKNCTWIIKVDELNEYKKNMTKPRKRKVGEWLK